MALPVDLEVCVHAPASLPVARTIQNTKNSHVYFSALPDGQPVVVKRAKITGRERLGRFWKEVGLLQQAAQFARVVPIIGVINSAPNYAIVMPEYTRGSLFHLLHHSGASELPVGLRLSLGLDFAQGIEFLHSRLGHVSKDIKPGNCVVGADWRAVLCDLENAESIESLQRGFEPSVATGPSGGYFKKFMVGTMVYMAPELLKKEPFTVASDVYSFGVSLNELLTGTVPYSDVKRCDDDLQFHTVIEASYSQQALMQAVCTKQLRPHQLTPEAICDLGSPSADYSLAALNQLVDSCWTADPASRPTMAVVCSQLEQAARAYPMSAPSELAELSPAAPEPASAEPATAPVELVVREGSAADVDWSAVFASVQANQTAGFSCAGGHEAMPGRRGSDKMEDRSFVCHELAAPHAAGVHLFGVFDGHGGQLAADFANRKMPGAVLAELALTPGDASGALQRAFVSVDRGFAGLGDSSGATALVVLVVGQVVLLANAGDCRAVVNSAGEGRQLTTDHTASLESERDRVLAAGGSITKGRDGKPRVGGKIQVTRAIGDQAMKEHGLVAEPEISLLRVSPQDDFLLLATDGVWDTVSNEEAARDVARTARHVDFGAKALCMRAWDLGSDDNISAVCIYFNHKGVDYDERAITRH